MSKQQRLLPADCCVVVCCLCCLLPLIPWASFCTMTHFQLLCNGGDRLCSHQMGDKRKLEDVCGFKSHLAEEEVELRSTIFEVAHQPSFPLSLDRFWEA